MKVLVRNNHITLPPKHKAKFCLVGSGKTLSVFTKMLIDNNFPTPIIVTWKKKFHERDIRLLKGNKNYVNIFEFSKTNNIELIEADNINDFSVIEELKRRNISIVFSISSRWILHESIINQFNGFVFNIHAGYLPRDRGSVVYSKILNQFHKLGVTIHIITALIDGGPILMKCQKEIKTKNPTINKITFENNSLSINLLSDFLYKISNHEEFVLEQQIMDDGFYFPQPYTELNGFINWNWKLKHIESFIRAFGEPMPGAATFYKGEKIRLLEGYVEKTEMEFHPIYYGRIVNVTKKGFVKIATDSGCLVLTKIKVKNTIMLPKDYLKIPNILYTPLDILEKARIENKNSLQMEVY